MIQAETAPIVERPRINYNLILFVLALVGVGISLFLTIKYLQNADIGCGASNDCNDVAADKYGKGLGIPALKAIPTPVFGLLMYVTMVALSLARVLSGSETFSRMAGRLQWALAAVGVIVSIILTHREYVIQHWCKYCIASAIIILLIFLLATTEQISAPRRAATLQREDS